MISQVFIDRPRLAIVISIVTVLLGGLCLLKAPVAEYPEIAPPSLVVFANYTGASAEEVADTVATVIEEQMNGLEDLLYFSSTSSDAGLYNLSITFKSGTDTDIALVNVQNAVSRAEPLLPQIVKDNGVKYFKRSSDILALYNFSTDGSELNQVQLSNYIRTNIRDPLARVDGVSEVSIMGERNYSMRIWVDPVKLSALNITPDDVAAAVRSQNQQAAAGAVGTEFSHNSMQLKVKTLGRLKTVEEFGNIVIRSGTAGRQVKLKDIARIELGAEQYANSSAYNGEECVALLVYRNDDSNAIEVIDRVNALLKQLSKTYPKGVSHTIAYDPTKYIRISLEEITMTLLMTLILVVVITYLFLQDWRATLIPTITIPVSLIGTFIFLIPLGFSINLLTMFALILVIGSLVDDAIVVTENTMSIMEKEGLSPKEAASKSMQQITGAVIATTLVIVAIYAPVGFYGGMVGTIYVQFAVTMCIALCLSTVNALTLSPALCSILLRKPKPTLNPFFKGFNFCLNKSCGWYLKVSGFLIRYIIITVILFGGVLFLNYFFYKRIPGSFIPTEDKGAFMGSVELPPGAALKRTDKTQTDVLKRASKIPGVKDIITVSGFSFTGGTGENVGLAIFVLEDWDKRTTKETEADEIMKKIQGEFSQIPTGSVQVFQPPAIMGLGVTGGISFQLQCTGKQTPQDLEAAIRKLVADIRTFPGVRIAFCSYDASSPQLYLDIDRDKAEAMGVPVSRIFSVLQGNIASAYLNDFNLQGYSFKVKLQAEGKERETVNTLKSLMVKNNEGKMVPLSSFATMRYTVGPRLVTRFNQYMSAQVNVILVPGTPSSSVMTLVEKAVSEKLGRDYSVEWIDMARQERDNEGRILLLLLFATVFGYLFLVGQYESWTIPLPVMLTISFATLGGLIGLKYIKEIGALFGVEYTNMDLSIYAQLGLVMLIGLSSKNAILMVEFSKQAREEGLSIKDAAQEGFKQRYRAVLMTAWSFVIGVFPMVIATGAGSESRRAIGVTTFYGMLLATLIGIVFIPPLFVIFQTIGEKIMGGVQKRR